MENTYNEIERLIIIAVNKGDEHALEVNLLELKELISTAGCEVVGTMTQKRDSANRQTYFGKGKICELKDYINLVDATGVVCDDELSPAQIRNLTDMLETKVMDRTMVILDIFARRALSREGKSQVELAQLKYNQTRLIGLGKVLSRQGGGIGTKGPGEKKLETDRRLINDRISELEKEIEQIKTQRKTQREKRKREGIPIVSIVGYTNAGKSTLMNLLTNADVLADDKLFMTLDTTTRKLRLPSTREVLLTDTVGFIQKLPHTLIKAFNATLEELKYADVLIHVVDVSSFYYNKQIDTVYETLKELKCDDKPIVTVLNKRDLIGEDIEIIFSDAQADETILISAKSGINIESFLLKLEELVNKNKKQIKLLIPFSETQNVSFIYKYSQIISEEYTDDGVVLLVIADEMIINKYENYII